MTIACDRTLADIATAPTCEHGWVTESRHATSEGVVLYVRCGRCGARRVDLQPIAPAVPVGLSRTI